MRDTLKRVPLLAGLTESDLNSLAEKAECIYIKKGDVLFNEGAAGDRAYVIEAGEIEVIKHSSGREVLLAVRKPGEVIGEMSLMEDAPRMASARARTDVTLLTIDKESLDELLDTSASAAKSMLYTILARWRATGTMLKQSERLAQLGTLTAGVAHELNNPAAAVKRGASHLGEVITSFGAAERSIGALGVGDDPGLAELGEGARRSRSGEQPEDPLDRADRESDIESWLDEVGVAEPWELAPQLADQRLDRATLAALAAGKDRPVVEAMLKWLVSTHGIHSLLEEVSEGARRISEIVKALKTYSYLDQAPVQSVDLHEGLDSTLLILRSKLKKGITVRKEYAENLPKIHAFGSELNQVWTNLLDNAADALGGEGNIIIRTRSCPDTETVEVDIEDDGPGVPEDIQGKIFDAFFTTKPPGKGTGLGLDISYSTVVNRHRGDIKLVSRPGMTRFRVILPVNFEAGGTKATVEAIPRATDAQLLKILESTRTIAVVGARDRPGTPGYDIPKVAQKGGYKVYPVNPTIEEALGEKAYPDLASLPEVPDVVLIFQRSEKVPLIVEEAITVGAKVVWMQPGIVHESAAERALEAGLKVVMDTCWAVTMRRLLPR